MFKRLELPDTWHQILQEHAHTKGVLFLSSVADHSVVVAGTIVEGVAIPPYSLVIGNPMQIKPEYYINQIKGDSTQ